MCVYCGGTSQLRVWEEDKGMMVGLPGEDTARQSSLRLAEVGQLPVRQRGKHTALSHLLHTTGTRRPKCEHNTPAFISCRHFFYDIFFGLF